MDILAPLYRHRFDESELPEKNRIWRVLCSDFFSRYITDQDDVLDLACGFGEFINNIDARSKTGVDINPDSPEMLHESVRFIAARSDDMQDVADSSVDVVFTSNFLEHLETKVALLHTFAEVKRVLRPSGRFLIMGPNIRYVYDRYWDFLDHHLPLSHETLEEAFAVSGFEMVESIPRFLPYSTRSSLPTASWLIRLYLRLPLAWKFLGKQFFIVGRKPLVE
jgi:SAM-dependent methyltransferase